MQPKPSVLLVEDEGVIALDLERELSDAGYNVVVATNGDRAIDALDKPGSAFAAVVTDIRLGAGANGWAVARYARRNNPAVAIVYMSGDSTGDWAAEGVPSSVMLSKPFAVAQLITAVSSLSIETSH